MIKLEEVSKIYYNKGILATGFSKINLELKMGEFVVITGESGSGKSTLLNVISGLDSYEEGEMYINGQETSHYTEKDLEEYRRKYIANIFQSFNLINSYTVYQNVELVLLLNGYKKRKVKKKILEVIDQVGLTKFKNVKVSKLSGGQKQRVAIARAIVKETPIIVADEPTGNLDTESAKDVIDILRKVAKDKLVIMVTHNVEQVEQYATRIIKMHDGKIIENREIAKVEDNIEIKESQNNKISLLNKWRLGIRNTFNIKSKFILLFLVFFFITSALLLEYASFQLSEENSTDSYSINFKDLSEKRVLIKKEDKTAFSEEDYAQIKNLPNIDYIVQNDLFLDTFIELYRDSNNGENIFFTTTINEIDNFKEQLDIGRMPSEENEIILKTSNKNYHVESNLEEVLEKDFSIGDYGDDSLIDGLKVVGIKFNEKSSDYDSKIYMSSTQIEKLRIHINKGYSKITTFFENHYIQNQIIPSEKVASGSALVSTDWNYLVKSGKVKGKEIIIGVNNIYYTDEINLKINNTFTKYTFNKLTGYENFDRYRDTIFINSDDYKSLYDKPSYQSSIYVKDVENMEETLANLNNMGIVTKKVTDFARNEANMSKEIIKLIKVIVTIILIFILFFISYFIIKVILKSRNIYYTTLRMLGATNKAVRKILDIELFINSNLAYFTTILIIYLTKANVIHFDYLSKLVKFLGAREYVLMYIIIVLMSKLISRKVSKKIFKSTAISTYNEEV